MDNQQAEILLYQVMSGYRIVYVEDKTYLVGSPTISHKRQAAEIYQTAYDSTAFDMWMTDNQIKSLLVSIDYITPEVDENFKAINTRIEDLKVELFQCVFDSDKRVKVRSILDKVRSKLNDMFYKRHIYDAMTRKGYAEIVKTQSLVALALTHEDGRPVFEKGMIHNASFSLLDKIIKELNTCNVSESDMRFIARSELWRGYWVVAKSTGNPFGIPSISLTDDQRTLCQITRMYDSAFEHPECPEQEVIKDDDCFDGWMIQERRKGEKDRNQKMADSLTGGRHTNAQEVFIPAGTQKDANKINELNDVSAQIVKKQREVALKAKGTLNDAELPDQKMRLRTEIAQLTSSSMKNTSKG